MCPDWKAGDKVRIINNEIGSDGYAFVRSYRGIATFYKLGGVLELVNAFGRTSPCFLSTSYPGQYVACFLAENGDLTNEINQRYFVVPVQLVEKIMEEEKHLCTCPAENFFWNGKGCVCGGR